MRTRRVRAIAAAFAVAAGIAAIPAAADAAQLTVDDGAKTDCPSAGFTSIQAAVSAATAGDTISICPGTYTEGTPASNSGLNVNKALTIKGAGSDLVTIKPPAANISNGTARDAIGNAVNVTAGPTTISGVTVDAGQPGGAGTVDSGVAFINAGNSTLRNSRVNLGQQVGISGTGVGVIYATPGVATGSFTGTLANTLVQGYSKAGVLVDASDAAGTTQPTLLNGVITGNRIEGGGPDGDTPQGQQGIQVSRGATAQITGNTITLNRSADTCGAPCNGASEGVLVYDEPNVARYNQITLTGNNIQGNSYGIVAVDVNGALPPAGVNINATGNYWGSYDGPTVVDLNTNPNNSNPDGDQVQGPNQGVDYSGFSNRPLALQNAPGAESDAAPVVTITAPTDGATVQPGTAVNITATATDDIGVKSVAFRQGNTALGTDGTSPYAATYTPTAAQAGTSQVITATATDSKGQTSTTAIAVQVAGAPAKAEDTPPKVALTVPKLKVGKTATLTATASDDAGVASVAFYKGGKLVCTDSSSPYSCDVKLKKSDGKKVAFAAIATDTAGQTSTDIKSGKVKVKKKK